MEVFVCILVAWFAIGTVEGKDNCRTRILAACFGVSMAVLVVLKIM